jgi:hypothetical protein
MDDLKNLASTILLAGGPRVAYRDPAAIFHAGRMHLFFTVTQIEADGAVFMYVGTSSSADLQIWTPVHLLTPRDNTRNFSSPGNVVRFRDEWILCQQTYPRPNGQKYGSGDSRLWIARSIDLYHWSEPELLRVKGPEIEVGDMGRMIDPFLLRDKDNPDTWWCFYKQNGVSMSRSTDLVTWTFVGYTEAGENACVLIDGDDYLLVHSPENGIGFKRSRDLQTWTDAGYTTLGQDEWPWARGRVTAGFVLDRRTDSAPGAFILLFHGSGPEDEHTMFDCNASIGIAWSDDLKSWHWPGQTR